VGHEGYGIDEQLTATAGSALCDAAQGYVTAEQAALVSSLVDLQRDNLYRGEVNIVSLRTSIATLLRGLIGHPERAAEVRSRVLELSALYGELDGENNYHYATVFANLYRSLSDSQKNRLEALRQRIMSGAYADGTPFDFSLCKTPFLYAEQIRDTAALAPYLAASGALFDGSSTAQPISPQN